MNNDQLIDLAVKTATTNLIGSNAEPDSKKFQDSVKSLYEFLKELNDAE